VNLLAEKRRKKRGRRDVNINVVVSVRRKKERIPVEMMASLSVSRV